MSYLAGGMAISIRGRQASRKEAPILVVAPHSSFLDSCIVYATRMSSVIVRKESMDNYVGSRWIFCDLVVVLWCWVINYFQSRLNIWINRNYTWNSFLIVRKVTNLVWLPKIIMKINLNICTFKHGYSLIIVVFTLFYLSCNIGMEVDFFSYQIIFDIHNFKIYYSICFFWLNLYEKYSL